jgi:hypothetical protein
MSPNPLQTAKDLGKGNFFKKESLFHAKTGGGSPLVLAKKGQGV